MTQKVPRVKFIIAPLNETRNIIYRYLTEGYLQSWRDMIYREYPKLKEKLKNIMNNKIRKKVIYEFFEEPFKNKKPLLEKKTKDFQSEWNKINDDIMKALSEIVETDWPKKDKEFIARVTLNYICTCNIKKRIFDVFYKQSFQEMKETCIHEISHFIYYEKWKQIFPKTKEKEFEPPHLVWHLLEMVPGIILNDKKIQRIFKNKFESYEEYRKLKINGRPILSYIQKFYDKRKNFEDFLKKSYEFIQKHEKEIKII